MSKILIAEDDRQLRELLQHIFEDQGHEITLARNGEEAINQFKTTGPDFAILDIIMPEKDGLELIQEIKENETDCKVLAISGGGSNHNAIMYLKMARQLGADFILPKPFHVEQLLQCMQVLGCEVKITENAHKMVGTHH